MVAQKLTVIYIEDHDGMRKAFSEHLSASAPQLDVRAFPSHADAESYLQAWAEAGKQEPIAVWTDNNIAGKSPDAGFTWGVAFRDENPNIPVIIYASDTEPLLAKPGVESFDAVIAKTDPHLFLKVAGSLMDAAVNYGLIKATPESEVAPDTKTTTPPRPAISHDTLS